MVETNSVKCLDHNHTYLNWLPIQQTTNSRLGFQFLPHPTEFIQCFFCILFLQLCLENWDWLFLASVYQYSGSTDLCPYQSPKHARWKAFWHTLTPCSLENSLSHRCCWMCFWLFYSEGLSRRWLLNTWFTLSRLHWKQNAEDFIARCQPLSELLTSLDFKTNKIEKQCSSAV